MIQTRVVVTHSYQKAYRHLSRRMQRIVDHKIRQLAENPAYPSLKVHRLSQANAENVYTCYITISKRLLYQYTHGTIILWDLGEHSIVERVHLRGFRAGKGVIVILKEHQVIIPQSA